MRNQERRYTLLITPTARRQLAEHLPKIVAFAVGEFLVGPLLDGRTGSARGFALRSTTGTSPGAAPTA